jgi:hypothetical protein
MGHVVTAGAENVFGDCSLTRLVFDSGWENLNCSFVGYNTVPFATKQQHESSHPLQKHKGLRHNGKDIHSTYIFN